jgi:hypothetical protein
MNARKRIGVAALLVLSLALAACDRQKIGDIVADPGSFNGREVAVAGRVTQSFGVLGRGIYEIEDDTGKLWVLSEARGVPSKGAYVGVKGRITPTVTFMGTSYATVMREEDRRAEKAAAVGR